jgi:galactokinase
MWLCRDAREKVPSSFFSGGRFEIFAPGRVNLIGEHTDYNGGRVLPFAIDLGISVSCGFGSAGELVKIIPADSKGPFVLCATAFSSDLAVVDLSKLARFLERWSESGVEREQLALPPEMRDSWARYAVGAIATFWESSHAARRALEGISRGDALWLNLASTLPVGSGLSSSAALCTALISGLSMLTGVAIGAESIARMAMGVEHRFSGTKCGLMDQLAVMRSRKGHFTHVDFLEMPRSGAVSVEQIRAHENFSCYAAVAVHTGVTHSLADSEYNQRRATCERSLAILNAKFESDARSLGEFSTVLRSRTTFARSIAQGDQAGVRAALLALFQETNGVGDAERMAAIAAHAIVENLRVERAIVALKGGDVAALDVSMRESHVSLRDDYRVSCRELDVACDVIRTLGGELARGAGLVELPVVGPRMTGGGFGGSTVQLVHHRILEAVVQRMREADNPYTRATGKRPTVIVSGPQDGLRIAIV